MYEAADCVEDEKFVLISIEEEEEDREMGKDQGKVEIEETDGT